MHVVLVSVGTDGDIFPYVGLGVELQRRGHTATLLASEHYRPLAKQHGLGFHALLSTEENKALFEHPDFWNPWKTAQLCARWGLQFIRRQYEVLAKLATPETVFVANPGVFAVSLVHETHSRPWVSLVLQPGTIPSSIAPPIMPNFEFLARAPRPVWKAFWLGLDTMGHFLVGRELNRIRAELGLKPMRRIFQNWLSKQLTIGMFPDWYGPPQSDWPPQLKLAGFPMFEGGPDQDLPGDVQEFLRAGAPPVAFTFGTGMAHSATFFQATLEACELLGTRGIFLTKYRDQLPSALPSSLMHCPFAPFQKLFPRCAAILHHGGIGTVAKAMAAGVPQLIHPFCFDQPDNGVRVKKLGAGDSLPMKRVSGRRIAEALKPLLTDQARTKSRSLMKHFAGNSLSMAADFVETMARKCHHSGPS